MSSTAGVSVVTPKSYFCHQCNRTVALTPSPNSDLSCPNCNGGFLEEFDSPNPNPRRIPAAVIPDPFSLLAPLLLSSTSVDLENPRNFSNLAAPSRAPHVFDPFEFLQGHFQNLRNSGANFQIVVENHPSEPGLGLPPNFGDYFLGPGLEQLIQMLAENDPNRYGTPPASKKAVEGLLDVVVTEEIANSDSNSCAVCMDDFEVGVNVKQMPCKHMFHSDCLIPWLELHNSCPVCRHELPTDDPDYENRKAGPEEGRTGGSTEGERGEEERVEGEGEEEEEGEGERGGPVGNAGGLERRFRISMPWPFSVFALPEVGNVGEGRNVENENSGTRGSRSRDQQSCDSASEPRQESLD